MTLQESFESHFGDKGGWDRKTTAFFNQIQGMFNDVSRRDLSEALGQGRDEGFEFAKRLISTVMELSEPYQTDPAKGYETGSERGTRLNLLKGALKATLDYQGMPLNERRNNKTVLPTGDDNG